MKLTRCLFVAALFFATLTTILRGAEITCEDQLLCPEDYSHSYCRTSSFWFEAESSSGAHGDVVGITISLHYAPGFDLEFTSISVTACHDPAQMELVGEPVYSEQILQRNPLAIDFVPVAEDENPRHHGYGFHTWFGALVDKSPVEGSLQLMTVYYRLIGVAGESSRLSFCDGSSVVFGPSSCNFTGILDVRVTGFPLLSRQNRDSTLTILPGPTRYPNRPPEPPKAIVYPEVPLSNDVNLRVRVGNALAVPGDRDIPLDIFVTADVEYTGLVIPIDFDERYLRVARVQDYFLAGSASFDNQDALEGGQVEEGYVVLFSTITGMRRIAPSGEEFHAATIYFDVLESALEISETKVDAKPVGGRAGNPFVIVRHISGSGAEAVEVSSQFGALQIRSGALAIRAVAEALRGDANFDGAFDISDPIAVLNYLFLGGEEPLCSAAADYEDDGAIVISDAIRMLSVLFGGQNTPVLHEGLVACR